jgi:hypothetical protein
MRPSLVALTALSLSPLLGCGSSGEGAGGSASTTASGDSASSASGAGGAIGAGGATGAGGAIATTGAGGATSASTGDATTATATATSAAASSSASGGPMFSCSPSQQPTTNGGGTCSGLNQAWTARGINVGYYAFKVTQPLTQYSGDFSGAPGTVFQAGAASKGVILQVIPPGSYVGLSSTGPYYDPPSDCFPAGKACGDPSHSACPDSNPPMRPALGGFVWGYAYSGASHMQGWIPFDPASLEFAGYDAGHPCALGPAGLDYEVHSACGQATSCAGTNPTCGATNKCDEGQDDCGNTICGAVSGGPLTPAAWHRTVSKPSGGHACTQKTPPHPSVTCLANGGDADFFFIYPFGAYAYWAQNSTTKNWLHYGDKVQVYYHTHDAQDVVWDFVEVLQTGAVVLTPASDGAGAPAACTSGNPAACTPCKNGGSCGWVQDVFLK